MATTPRPNAIDYVEMPSRDLPRTKAFFSELFGWTFTDYGPGYTSFDDGRVSGGFHDASETAAVSRGSVLVVFYRPDLEFARDEALRLGATLSRDIFAFPGGRRFHFVEPGGSEFAIWSDR